MQQRAGGYFPAWIRRVTVAKAGGSVNHVVATEPATLVYLAGQASITLHPWLSLRDRLNRPDRLVFDLDPSDSGAAAIRRGARAMAALVRELGLEPWAMTTGSRGYHVTVPLRRRADFDEVRAFAREVAELARRREPRLFTTEQRKAKREGRILIDVMRNAYAQAAVAPYAVRARPGAPVATPLHLEELAAAGTRADRWTLRAVLARVERDGDPWAQITKHGQELGAARRRLRDALAEAR